VRAPGPEAAPSTGAAGGALSPGAAQGAKSFTITARSALRALAEQRRRERPGLASALAGWTDRLAVEARLAAFALLSWLAQLRQGWLGWAARA